MNSIERDGFPSIFTNIWVLLREDQDQPVQKEVSLSLAFLLIQYPNPPLPKRSFDRIGYIILLKQKAIY